MAESVESFELCRHDILLSCCHGCQSERIADLETKLASLSWTPITPDNLPKVGDEVWAIDRGLIEPSELTSSSRTVPTYGDWIKAGYTHFRPINPPFPASKEGK
jgi:hypothetical protein